MLPSLIGRAYITNQPTTHPPALMIDIGAWQTAVFLRVECVALAFRSAFSGTEVTLPLLVNWCNYSVMLSLLATSFSASVV